MDRLLVDARKITEKKKRYEAYSKVARILHDDAPELPKGLEPPPGTLPPRDRRE